MKILNLARLSPFIFVSVDVGPALDSSVSCSRKDVSFGVLAALQRAPGVTATTQS